MSITAKQKKKDAEKKKDSSDKMDVDEEKPAATDKKEEEPKKEEPLFEVLSNPARVMRPQLQVISMEDPAKYKPIKDITIGGNVNVATRFN